MRPEDPIPPSRRGGCKAEDVDPGIDTATFPGRDRPSGDAIGLVEVDQAVPETTLTAIDALPQVLQVKQLAF